MFGVFFCCVLFWLLLLHLFMLYGEYDFSFEHAEIMTFTFHVRICCDGRFSTRTVFILSHSFTIPLSLSLFISVSRYDSRIVVNYYCLTLMLLFNFAIFLISLTDSNGCSLSNIGDVLGCVCVFIFSFG